MKGDIFMKKNLKKAVVLLLALVMALTPVQVFAAEKQYFYLSNTSQTRISMGIHDSDEDYKVTIANKKIATIQKSHTTKTEEKLTFIIWFPKSLEKL